MERVPDYPSIRPEPTIFGPPEPDFSRLGRYPTLHDPDFFWFLGKIQIFGYIRRKYPTFLVLQSDFLYFSDYPTRIRLFTTRTIRYPIFCYPLHHYSYVAFFQKLIFLFSGSGNFSEVFVGTLREKATIISPSKSHEVAIKVLRNTGQSCFVEFYKEVAVLVHLRHENVVEFFGISHVSSSTSPCMMMIFKLMKG